MTESIVAIGVITVITSSVAVMIFTINGKIKGLVDSDLEWPWMGCFVIDLLNENPAVAAA